MDSLLALEDLSLSYPARVGHSAHRAVSGVSLTLRAGETLLVSGGAGAGKSTLARALSLRADPKPAPRVSGGAARVLGAPLTGFGQRARRDARTHIGYLAQRDEALFATRTITQGLAAVILDHTPVLDHPAVGARIAELLDAVHLPLSVLDRFPSELSSGQRRRIALAGELAREPRLLILDEPTAGLDPTVRAVVSAAVARTRAHGGGVVLVSNDDSLAAELGAHTLVLERGTPVGWSAARV
ncbi:ATP-binding cassette domain-containing protein [Mycetocola tolaasinivorans]|uniref:ATP-binding cassette domain-containing protein n=1 Tax=Mycetocola tolaasinivorans TaxID=76635 RepID=A0A3L7AA19_9MICO|nr:ATP-binding cassette domain-containing protein [Mycetocola tolaasinivorans]RLP76895.1 ATP-binding cassette domain-containing protein [Mycetocola tolaasinivorans]